MNTKEVISTAVITRAVVADNLQVHYPGVLVDDLHWSAACSMVDMYVAGMMLSEEYDPNIWEQAMDLDAETYCHGLPGEESMEHEEEEDNSHGMFMATFILESLTTVLSDNSSELREQDVEKVSTDGLWAYSKHSNSNDAIIFDFKVRVGV